MAIPFSKTSAVIAQDTTIWRSFWVIPIFLICLLWGLWFFLVPIHTYSVSQNANLESLSNSMAIYAKMDGEISEIHTKLDQSIKKKSPIISLALNGLDIDLENHQRQLQLTKVKVDSLNKELISLKNIQRLKADQFDAAIQSINQKIVESEIQSNYSKELYQRLQLLNQQGNVSEIDLIEAQSDVSLKTHAVATLKHEKNILEKNIAVDREQIKQSERHTQLALARELSEQKTLETSIKKLKLNIERSIIYAQRDGRIGELKQLYIGMAIKKGERLGTLSPNKNLKVVAYFSPADAFGHIFPGQQGNLSFDGFPWTQYGKAWVTVNRVAKEIREGLVKVELDVSLPESSSLPMQHGMPATVALETQKLTPALLVLRAAGKLKSKMDKTK